MEHGHVEHRRMEPRPVRTVRGRAEPTLLRPRRHGAAAGRRPGRRPRLRHRRADRRAARRSSAPATCSASTRRPPCSADAAAHAGERVRFEEGDLATFDEPGALGPRVRQRVAALGRPTTPACWPGGRRACAPGGQLAVQVPTNADHAVAPRGRRRRPRGAVPVAHRRHAAARRRRRQRAAAGALRRAARRLGFVEQHVRLQVYGHHLDSTADVVEWVKGTSLTRFQRHAARRPYDAASSTATASGSLAELGDRRRTSTRSSASCSGAGWPDRPLRPDRGGLIDEVGPPATGATSRHGRHFVAARPLPTRRARRRGHRLGPRDRPRRRPRPGRGGRRRGRHGAPHRRDRGRRRRGGGRGPAGPRRRRRHHRRRVRALAWSRGRSTSSAGSTSG